MGAVGILDKTHVRSIHGRSWSRPAFLSQLISSSSARALGFSYIKLLVVSGYATSTHHRELLFIFLDGDGDRQSVSSQIQIVLSLTPCHSHLTLLLSHSLGCSHRALLFLQHTRHTPSLGLWLGCPLFPRYLQDLLLHLLSRLTSQ